LRQWIWTELTICSQHFGIELHMPTSVSGHFDAQLNLMDLERLDPTPRRAKMQVNAGDVTEAGWLTTEARRPCRQDAWI